MVCDVTTLNFNVLFELGYAIGLGLPVFPIRDTSFEINRLDFDSLALLDTLGYIDFNNSPHLREQLISRVPGQPLPEATTRIHKNSPIYFLPGPIQTDGVLELSATLKKSRIRFRTYDPVETPRLSLHEAKRQVAGSVGVIANLLESQTLGLYGSQRPKRSNMRYSNGTAKNRGYAAGKRSGATCGLSRHR